MPKFRVAAGTLGFLALTLLVYQNCMPLSEKMLEAESEVTPYPWDLRIDTVGVMSCNKMGENNPQNYFSFRGGALQGDSGVGTDPGFHSWARQNNYGTVAKKTELVQSESAFSETLVQASLRDVTNITTLIPQGGPSLDDDVYRIWYPGSMGQLAPTVLGLPSGSRMSISPTGQRFLGQISFVEGRDWAQSIRQLLGSSNSYAVFGYQNPGTLDRQEGLVFHQDSNGAIVPHGMGFQMNFAYPTHVPAAGGAPVVFGNHGQKVLYQVYPSFLKTAGRSPDPELTNFKCPLAARFKIIPTTDTVVTGLAAGCQPGGNNPSSLAGEQRKIYDAADLILNGASSGARAWNIDVVNRCITRNTTRVGGVPAEGQGGAGPLSNCYAHGFSIEFSNDPAISCCSAGSQCPAGQKLCLEYFSLCASYLAP